MKILTNSFYAKISGVFLFCVLFLGGTLAYITLNSSMMFVEETTQKVNVNLAEELANELQPYLIDAIESDSIVKKIQHLKGINPQIDIYLLKSNGMIKESYLGEDAPPELAMATVDTSSLDAFLRGDALPIMGQDPLNPDIKKPFSVANISIMGSNGCYLYVILESKQYSEIAGMLAESYIIKNSMISLLIILLTTVFLGLLVFRLLTHRLRNVTRTVVAFEHGQLDERVDVKSNDELGILSTSFNQMADTIVANMDEIKQVDRLRRELIANVSHDLRSPLASIQGYLETIQQKEAENTLSETDRKKYYDVVIRNTKKLGKLISELFELSKLDAKNVQPDLEPVSIAELAQDVVMQFQPLAKAKNVQLKAVLPDEPLKMVTADIALMERAISNLIDNAIKNTPEGGEVCITPANAGNQVTVQISDTGKGIPEDQLSRIFDRFYQADASRSPGTGAGLGLSIAQKILELHGTKLSVQSALNQGTTFSFSLVHYVDKN
ncbi:MAG: HAMP domain-containing histidine kinase [Balneolaceae bacterium]|nr:HAMP domain-containing histidine kinase [Balneolaceae bacterium]